VDLMWEKQARPTELKLQYHHAMKCQLSFPECSAEAQVQACKSVLSDGGRESAMVPSQLKRQAGNSLSGSCEVNLIALLELTQATLTVSLKAKEIVDDQPAD